MNVNQDIIERSYVTDDFDLLLGDLLVEIETRNYLITRINHIDNIFERQKEGIDIIASFRKYKIVEFCNLNSCSELISSELLAGVFMPVRFTIYQTANVERTNIAFLDPAGFARLFQSDSLNQIAKRLSRDMHDVLDELDL